MTPESTSTPPDTEVTIEGSTFTLRTLFVVTTCVAAVLALLVPAIQHAREAERRMKCTNTLRQIMLGMHNYEAAHKVLPKSFQPHSQLSWTIPLVPYMEATALGNLISHATGPYYSVGKNDPHGLIKLSWLHCPASSVTKMELDPPSDVSPLDLVPPNTGGSPYTLHYYGISGPLAQRADGSQGFPLASPLTFEGAPVAGSGMLQWNTYVSFRMVMDGLSNTLCVGEMSWTSPKFGTRYRSWMHGGTDGSYLAGCRNIAQPINAHRRGPVLIPLNNMPMGSQHRGGTQFGVGDGSVVFLAENMDFPTYQVLSTRDGGEPTGEYAVAQ